MMLVYRVETIDCIGPYSSSLAFVLGESHSKSPYSHPDLHASFPLDRLQQDIEKGISRAEYHCGFDSIGQLIDWFAETLNILIKHEFIVSVYEIEDVVHCIWNKQIFFRMHLAKLKERLTIESIR